MKNTPVSFSSERGLGVVQIIILSTLISHGIHFGMPYFQTNLNGVSPASSVPASQTEAPPWGSKAPATANGGEGIEALKALKRLALQEKKTPLVITPEEMKELVTTVQILQHDGKYACPANSQELAQDPLFSKAFGIRVLNDGGMVPVGQ